MTDSRGSAVCSSCTSAGFNSSALLQKVDKRSAFKGTNFEHTAAGRTLQCETLSSISVSVTGPQRKQSKLSRIGKCQRRRLIENDPTKLTHLPHLIQLLDAQVLGKHQIQLLQRLQLHQRSER